MATLSRRSASAGPDQAMLESQKGLPSHQADLTGCKRCACALFVPHRRWWKIGEGFFHLSNLLKCQFLCSSKILFHRLLMPPRQTLYCPKTCASLAWFSILLAYLDRFWPFKQTIQQLLRDFECLHSPLSFLANRFAIASLQSILWAQYLPCKSKVAINLLIGTFR